MAAIRSVKSVTGGGQKVVFPATAYRRRITTCLFLMVLAGCTGVSTPQPPVSDNGQYRSLARAVFDETNKMRANPVAFEGVLKDILKRMSGNIYYPLNRDNGIKTNEGPGAVKEAIAVLGKQNSLPVLKWSEELAELAREHVIDTGSRGLTGHNSSTGKAFSERVSSVMAGDKFVFSSENLAYGYNNARDVVAQLIVDDGVPGRGHRKNMLKEQLNYTGVACGYHRQYGHMCAAIYATRAGSGNN